MSMNRITKKFDPTETSQHRELKTLRNESEEIQALFRQIEVEKPEALPLHNVGKLGFAKSSWNHAC